MSVTISNCDEICRSPTNSSPSKMLFSFPKTARFNSRRIILCDKYYQLPSSVNTCRTTSLGFGNKYDFTRESPSAPPPNTYTLRSQFDPNKSVGFGFGKGRDQMETTGPLLEVKKNKNPGPGTYQSKSTLATHAFSLTGKLHEEDRQKMKIPGPGTYPITFCINKKGEYFLAKYKNSCVQNFSKLENRCAILTTKVPGPGAYDTSKADLSPRGKYVMSKMHNCLTRKFAITTRKPLAERNDSPGPGNYKIPSQFGHYVSRKTYDASKTITKPHAIGQKQN